MSKEALIEQETIWLGGDERAAEALIAQNDSKEGQCATSTETE